MAYKKITIADIAKKLDLSPTTVSFVLNGRDSAISEVTRNSVLKTAEKMGYKKTAQATPPNDSRRTRIAYVLSNVEFFNRDTTFFSYVFNHLQKMAAAEKFELFLLEFNPGDSFLACNKKLQEIRSMGIDICISHSSRHIECMKTIGVKSIIVQGDVMPDTVCIYCDDYAAGREAALHALEMGHRRAGMIFAVTQENPRFKGFYETFTANGGICEDKYIWMLSFNHAETALKIEELAKTALKLPSLFYCYADNLMFPAIRGFAKAGLKVPQDISLIGADNLYWGALATPAFTTVDLNEKLFAEKVAEAIRHLKNNGAPYDLAVPVKLVARETVLDLRVKHRKS